MNVHGWISWVGQYLIILRVTIAMWHFLIRSVKFGRVTLGLGPFQLLGA